MTSRSYRNSCFSAAYLVSVVLLFPIGASAEDVSASDRINETQQVDVPLSAEPDLEFSPSGPFQGPLEISHIARFDKLPMRMFLEPRLISPGIVRQVDSSFVELFDKTLREFQDNELLEIAASSLARVADEKLNNISRSTDILLKHLKSHPSPRVRIACARALVNADVSESASAILALNAEVDDSQRLWIDPALARWKFSAAGDVWKQRLSDESETVVAVSLACDGLAALGDEQASDLLLSVLRAKLLPYEKRRAAARAIGMLVPDVALIESESLVDGSILERLLAVELLSSAKPEAHARLLSLCQDESDGVASSAWSALHRVNPHALVEIISAGRKHRDAAIRIVAARVMRLFPNVERLGWLHEQLGDKHLEVRNVAREMLFQVAEEHPELRERIIAVSGETLTADFDDWQGIEQNLLLLGQLRVAQFSDRCIPLLDHPRNEVLVTSAWLLHLFPDPTVVDGIKARLIRNEESLQNPEATSTRTDVDQQSSYLIQYAGLLRLGGVQPYLEPAISKAPRVYTFKRAAAIWTLGLLNENNPEHGLVKSLAGRVADRLEPGAEQLEVRRISAVALGLMRANSASTELLDAYNIDPALSVIPDSARWALGMMGQPLPDPVKPYEPVVGNWRLSPIPDP